MREELSSKMNGPDAFVSAEMRRIWQERDKTNANAWDNMWPT
jgi:hypothetical protein